MSSVLYKFLAIILLFLGEAFAIYAEIIGAKKVELNPQYFWSTFGKMFLIMAVGGAFLVMGYMLGIHSFKNIWVLAVISITSIIAVEPFLAWGVFHQMPTTGAIIGGILGIIGLIVALVF